MSILENTQESEETDSTKTWHKTACVLCSANCGLEVRLDGREITRVRGNKAHVASAGYTCEKGLRINSFRIEGGLRTEFETSLEHQAFPGIINGGIIGTLLDCHGNWTAAMSIFESNNEKKFPSTVTAFFEVQLLKPTPIDTKVEIFSQIVSSTKNKAKVQLELFSKNAICAKSEGVFVGVKEGHPAFYRW